MNVPALARPLRLGPVTLRNRIVGAPMERNYCATDGTMTDHYIAYLAARAAGGAALLFTEAAYVRADGKGRVRQLGVDDDRHVPGIARLARAVHRHGAMLGVELNHGGRTAQSRVHGQRPVAPSPVPCLPAGGDLPVALSRADIADLVECYGAAARRCREAGVDVLSVHAAHGYLIHQFMSPATNHRSDEFRRPDLFLNLVLESVRRAAPDLAIGMRVSALEGTPGGLDAEQTLGLVRSARLDLLDFIDVSAGNYEAGQWMVQPGEWRPGVLAPYAARYRELGLPVGVAGRIGTPEIAEAIVAEGQADFVSLARALHADPGWPGHALAGRRFRPCIACNLCIDQLHTGRPVPCSVNPDVAAADRPRRATGVSGSRILVVGAGPAGLESARLLAAQGNRVELVERETHIGGRFRLAAGLRAYPEYHRILDWYARELAGLPVDLRTGVEADGATIAGFDGDAVVLATGGRGHVPDVPGADLPHVIDLLDWLRLDAGVPERCTIWGADREAMAVADHLAGQGGEVLIVGAQPSLAPDVGPRAKGLIVARLTENPKVRILLDSRVRRIERDRILVSDPSGRAWVAASGPVLVSQGVEPAEHLAAGPEVHLVGDAAGNGGSMWAALHDAASLVTALSAR